MAVYPAAQAPKSKFWTGREGHIQQADRFREPQQQAFSQILQQALSGLQDPTKGFAPIAQQARSQFQKQTVPSIFERFSNMDAQRSSAFADALGGAGADLEERLAAMGSQYGLQQQGLLQQLLSMGLTPQFENIYMKREPGLLEALGAPLLQGLGQGVGTGLTGGFGGASSFMNALKGMFGSRGGQQEGYRPPSQAQWQPFTSPAYQQQQAFNYNPMLSSSSPTGGSTAANLNMLNQNQLLAPNPLAPQNLLRGRF